MYIYKAERSSFGLIKVIVDVDILFLNKKLFWIIELLNKKKRLWVPCPRISL